MGPLSLLTGVTARLASAARFDEIVDTVVQEIVKLGFGAVWLAVLDEKTGGLSTLKDVIDGVDSSYKTPVAIDPRTPLGLGFAERRMINVSDPSSLLVLESEDQQVPPGRLGLW